MKLSDLVKKTRGITVTISGETAEVEYRLHAISVPFLDELKQLKDIDSIIRQVEQVVVRWDVLDDNGQEIPPTRAAIVEHEIPVEFLTAVINAITEDHRESADTKNG